MGLVRGQTKRIDIPDEPGEWVEIKKLPWGLLDGAREARTNSVIERAKLMGGDLMASLRAAPSTDAEPDALNEYDQGFLLRHGIASWSYDAELPDGTADLEPDTAEWMAREIVAFNRRSRTDAERLDAMSPSISR